MAVTVKGYKVYDYLVQNDEPAKDDECRSLCYKQFVTDDKKRLTIKVNYLTRDDINNTQKNNEHIKKYYEEEGIEIPKWFIPCMVYICHSIYYSSLYNIYYLCHLRCFAQYMYMAI